MAKLPDFTGLGSLPAPQPSRSVVPATLRPIEPHPAGQGLEALASGESNLAADISQAQDRMDTLRAEDAWTQLRSKQADLTYGQNGFTQLKGGDAVNAPLLKTYGDQLNQATGQIGGTLDNENQRRMFAQRAAISSLQMKEDILKHVDGQKNVYAEDVLNGTISSERQNAALNWADPNAPALPMERINAAIIQFARDYGKPQEWIDSTKEKARTGLYSDIVRQAMVVDPNKADQLMATYGNELNAAERATLEMQIKSHEYTLQIRDEMAQRRLDVENERLLKQMQDTRLNSMLDQYNQHKLTPDDVVKDDILTFPQKHVMLSMLDEQTVKQGQMKTDPRVFINLLDRIHLPDSSANKITDENDLLKYVKASGGIDYEGLQQLRKEVRDVRDPEQGPFVRKLQDLTRVAESDLTKTNNLAGIKDPKGDELLYEWKWAADKKIAQWKAKGNDPFDLLDPQNPNYLGNSIAAYRRTPMQIIQDMANEMRSTEAVKESSVPVAPTSQRTAAQPSPPAQSPETSNQPGLPAEAAAKLNEGMETRFKNGQIWTLENGKPKRVK